MKKRKITIIELIIILILIITLTAIWKYIKTSSQLSEPYIFLTKWGHKGSDDGEFLYPVGITVDSAGHIYVVDSWNSRIQKFDSNGNFITKWGTPGSKQHLWEENSPGEFIAPKGIAIDSKDNVYIADPGNARIQKFNSNGDFIIKWGGDEVSRMFEGDYSVMNLAWCEITEVVIKNLENKITDDKLKTLQPLINKRLFLKELNDCLKKLSFTEEEINIVTNYALDPQFKDFITKWDGCTPDKRLEDDGTNKIPVMTPRSETPVMETRSNTSITETQSKVPVMEPQRIAIDSRDNIYITDNKLTAETDRCSVKKFDPNGNPLNEWNVGYEHTCEQHLEGIAIDSSGYVYVMCCVGYGMGYDTIDEVHKHTFIQKFTPSGELLTSWCAYGKKMGGFNNATGITVDKNNRIFVAETSENRIQVFDTQGNFITEFGSKGSGNGQFRGPVDVAVDLEGNVYVLDGGNCRIQKFKPNPDFKLNVNRKEKK